MPEKPKDDAKTVAALQSLASSGVPPRGDARGASSRAPAAAQTSGGPAPERPTTTEWRCVACGYRLLNETGLRCSECGRQYTVESLQRWFGGNEQRRIEIIIWLIRFGLVAKLLALPELLNLYWLELQSALWVVNALAGAAVCLLAGRDKWDGPGGRYAIIGVIAAGFMFLAALLNFWQRGAVYPLPLLGCLDALCAGLAAISLSFDRGQLEIWMARRVRMIGLCGCVLAPAAFGAIASYSEVLGDLSSLTAAIPLTALDLIAVYVPSVGAWLLLWRWLASLRRMLFA